MTVKKTVFSLDRRDLLKWSGIGAAAFMFCDFDEMFAAGLCDKLDDVENLTAAVNGAQVQASSGELLYWIDGPLGKKLGANQTIRGRLAVHVDLPHNAESGYVEAVLLADSSLRLVAQQRFGVADANSQGRAPYAVFENLSFEDANGYFLFYVLRKGTNVTVYRFQLGADSIRRSRFDYSHLSSAAKLKIPNKFRTDIASANHYFGDDPNTAEYGWVTTPYQNFAGRPAHSVRAQIKSIGADGGFSIEVDPMHGDVDPLGHYMRYFIVMDPVGQILGAIRRPHGNDPARSQTFQNTGAAFTVQRGLLGDDLSGFTAEEKAAISARRILDCPYVHVVTEDVRDAIASICLRLR